MRNNPQLFMIMAMRFRWI